MSAIGVLSSLPPVSMIIAIVAVCILLPSAVFLIYKFSIREKSFEEVLEEQKRRNQEEELRQKSEKTKKEKKFKKTWANKKKDKTNQEDKRTEGESAPVPEQEVKLIPTIEIIEPKEVKKAQEHKVKPVPVAEIVEPKEAKPQKAKNKKPQAAANPAPTSGKTSSEENVIGPVASAPKKSTPSDVGASAAKKPPSSGQGESAKAPRVVPEVSVKKEEDAKSETAKVAKSVEKPKKAEVVTEKTGNDQSSPPAAASKKKKKEAAPAKDLDPLSTSQLVSIIKDADLDMEEIQNIVETLLNKQKEAASWSKRNEHSNSAKRAQEPQPDQHKAKLHDEYNQLRAKCSTMEKATQDKVAKLQQEVQAQIARAKQLGLERDKGLQMLKEMEEKSKSYIAKIEDEKTKLKQHISKLEAEGGAGVSKADLEAARKSRDDLQKVHNLLVEEHTGLVSAHKAELKGVSAQLGAAKKQLDEATKKNGPLLSEVKALKDLKAGLEKANKALEDRVKAEEIVAVELKQQVKQLTSKVASVAELQASLKSLQLENERLAEQLVTSKERVAGDGQEIVHQNGDLNGKIDEVSLKSLEEKDKLLGEKDTLIAQLNDDLKKLQGSIKHLEDEANAQKQKNNEIREKSWKAMDALKSSEEAVGKLQKQLAEASSAKAEVPKEVSERLARAEAEASERLSALSSEAEKNRSLSSEVQQMRSQFESSGARLKEMEQVVERLNMQVVETRNHTREYLQRIHPSVTIDSSLPHDAWLVEFEKQVVSSSKALEASSNAEELTRLSCALENKEKELLEKETYFSNLLATTDSTLNTLQNCVKVKEAEWEEQMKEKVSQLQQLQSERDELISQKDAMQSVLQVDQLGEFQEKLKLVQSTLQGCENEKSQLEQKYDEVNKNYINLKDQLDAKEKQIDELQKSVKSSDRLQQEIDDVKEKLEKERKISKDFSSQMIRLNSLVKIGQDSLLAEQETVKALRSQLEASQKLNANGSSNLQSSNTHVESTAKGKSSEKPKKKADASVKK